LRQPYSNYIDGVDEDGEIRSGLNFIACMRNIREQFEYVATMGQMNVDFPVKGTGIDALYAHKILSTIYGGYYFCPPAPRDERDFIGSALFPVVGGGGSPLLIRRMLPRVFVLR
jgi:deferrochelatase/peroxidase EfeB